MANEPAGSFRRAIGGGYCFLAEAEADAGGGVAMGADPAGATELALALGDVGGKAAADGSPEAGTRSAFTGLGRIAALPDIGVPTDREGPPHAVMPVPAATPKARHTANTAAEGSRPRDAWDERDIGDRVAEPQAFV
ncbi:MAG: hypothetical protein ABI175_04930 [Polyangiales bacterium]